MKATVLLFVIGLTILYFGCSENQPNEEINPETNISVIKSAETYSEIKSNPSDAKSDPFELKKILYEDGIIYLTVAYSGGCSQHEFTVTWDEVIRYSYPPIINLIITHDARGDMCEAYITETLEFQTNLLFDSVTINNLSVLAFNGSSSKDSLTFINQRPAFELTEGDECEVPVTAKYVACGNGLYDDLWFIINDSIENSGSTYHQKFLQPVEVADQLSDFIPKEGQKYMAGFRIMEDHNFMEESDCYSRPAASVPVKITCIREENN